MENWGYEAFQRGFKDGESICKNGIKRARNLIKYVPKNDYEKGKVCAAFSYLWKEYSWKHDDLKG